MDYEIMGCLIGLALWQNCTLEPWHVTIRQVIPGSCSLPFGKHTKNYGKSPFGTDKSIISMPIFNSFLYVYQRVGGFLSLAPWTQALPQGFSDEKTPPERMSQLRGQLFLSAARQHKSGLEVTIRCPHNTKYEYAYIYI
jgi:hypothetical protein